METPTVKAVKVYATLESVLEVPKQFSIAGVFEYLRSNKFKGETKVNCNQGGITNVITREIIPLTMKELDKILTERQK
jgi:hypothetical protein